MKDLFIKENILQILDHIDEGVHIIDSKGQILYYNKFSQRLDEIDKDKAIGRHILEIYPSLNDETSTMLQVIRTGEPIFNIEQTYINYKGDKITTVNSSLPLKNNNKVIGAMEISRDITQVKVLSERIVDLQKELYSNQGTKLSDEKRTASYTFVDIIGQCNQMLRLKSLALKASEMSSPVLVYGETGTGKELFVQAIHNAGPRKGKPFIPQNCAALPSTLLESILFGTVKGSFTGAEDRPGLFELANKGTLFLDEVNSMPLELQAKLLRVLQDGRIRRIGATKTIDVDVRIITAINVKPEEAVKAKELRKDLYYRLNVIVLGIPELKERKEDILILTDYFIDKYNKTFGKAVQGVSKKVRDIFMDYPWVGNVRELQHVIESILVLYDTEIIEVEHLPNQFNDFICKKQIEGKVAPLKERMEEVEKDTIIEALTKTDWNVTQAAYLMDIPRQTLQYKMKKYQLQS